MSPEEKKKFYDIAIARRAQMHSENSQEAQESESQYEHGQQEQVFDWDLSSADHVLKPNLVDMPKYTRKLETDIYAWTQAIEDMVCHEAILPKASNYDDVCEPGCCRKNPNHKTVEQISAKFFACCYVEVTRSFLILAEGPGNQSILMQPFLIAWTRDKPKQAVCSPPPSPTGPHTHSINRGHSSDRGFSSNWVYSSRRDSHTHSSSSPLPFPHPGSNQGRIGARLGRGRADVGLGSGKVGVGSLVHSKR